MRPLSSADVLDLWEAGSPGGPLDRAHLLHAAAREHDDPDALWDEPVGRRDAEILGLRTATFGPHLLAAATCPACAEDLDLEVDAAALLVAGEDGGEAVGIAFRVPTPRDLAAASDAQALLQLCIDHDGDLSGDEATALDAAIASADPRADLSIEMTCAVCAHAWEVVLDPGSFLWTEVEAEAVRVLADVHALALAYGWREHDVLALSPARRRAYLEMASG